MYIINKYPNKVAFLRKYFGMYTLSFTTVKKVLLIDKHPTTNSKTLIHSSICTFFIVIKSLNSFYSILSCHCSFLMKLLHASFQFWSEMSDQTLHMKQNHTDISSTKLTITVVTHNTTLKLRSHTHLTL